MLRTEVRFRRNSVRERCAIPDLCGPYLLCHWMYRAQLRMVVAHGRVEKDTERGQGTAPALWRLRPSSVVGKKKALWTNLLTFIKTSMLLGSPLHHVLPWAQLAQG